MYTTKEGAVMKIKSRDADKGTGRPVSLFSCAALLFEGFLALIAGRLFVFFFFRTYLAIPSLLSLPGLIIPNGADCLFCYQIFFSSSHVGFFSCWRVLLFSKFVSLSSYHLVSYALLVYVFLFLSAGLNPFSFA